MNFGGRTEFHYNHQWKKIGIEAIVGGEYQKTSGVYRSYKMYGGVLGDHTSDNFIATQQANIFTQWNILLPKSIKVTAGLSSNFLNYNISDKLANSSNPTHNDASGEKNFAPILTPRLAVQKVFNKHISAYVNASKGYSPPTASNVVIPYTGQVNTSLKSEIGMQYEIGSKGSLLDNKLSWQVALFSLNVNDKLSSQSVIDSGVVLYSYAINAGDQKNNGMEISLSYLVMNNPKNITSYLRPFASFTCSKFNYNAFKSDNNNNANTKDYSGNTVIGVPPILFNAGIDVATKWGVYFNSSFQYVDDMYLTFDNKHSAPAYSLLSAKIGYKKSLGKHFDLNVFAGGNNLTNSLYYNMVFVNWQKGSQPSIYSPGSFTPTFFGGLNLKYNF